MPKIGETVFGIIRTVKYPSALGREKFDASQKIKLCIKLCIPG
jgi:hypothetical protein